MLACVAGAYAWDFSESMSGFKDFADKMKKQGEQWKEQMENLSQKFAGDLEKFGKTWNEAREKVHAYLKEHGQKIFNDFKTQFGKRYANSTEEANRLKNVLERLAEIMKKNFQFKNGNSSYEADINEYSDKTDAEFESELCGAEKPETVKSLPAPRFSKRQNLPATVDWRNFNGKVGVTSVKNQGGCGSCYSFNTMAALEGQYLIKKGSNSNLDLAEQQIVDCSQQHGNHGCDGGWMTSVFEYIKAAGGVTTEASYPYRTAVTTCQNKGKAATVTGWKQVPGTEAEMQKAVATVGPIAAAIDANTNLQNYKKGVYDDATCTQQVNHAITVVGYGRDLTTGKDYWLVKNSWGTTWGEQGYVRMVRNKGNQCAIGSYGYYPVV
jgi:C1A family cysteine protease